MSEAHPSEPTKTAVQAPTLKELKNASYSGIEGLKGSVKLVDGKWKGGPHGKGSASRPVVSLVGDLRITGDLDGNGTDDAVVLLNYAPGSTGQLFYLAVVGPSKKRQNPKRCDDPDRRQSTDSRCSYRTKTNLRGCSTGRTERRYVLSGRGNHPCMDS